MSDNQLGKVVTFYSFKGGTGRTMALANVAWILASNGKRVLVADWDLDSPGLHRFFKPFIREEALDVATGVIGMVRAYEWATTSENASGEGWFEQYAKVQPHAFSLEWDHFPAGGAIDFLAAGQQNSDYARSLNAMNWDDFYDRLGGGQFFDAMREDMRRKYDYVLIDSRTGVSDVAGICTMQLPDILVTCFTYSEQGIDGASRVARTVHRAPRKRAIRVLPVAMRVDPAEKEKADAGRAVALERFTGLPEGMSQADREAYWSGVEVPYRPFYNYEETLATFGDWPRSPKTMLAAYETLASHITGGAVERMPALDEAVRLRTLNRFVRQVVVAEEVVALRYAPVDQMWAEWVEKLLLEAGIRVHDLQATPAGGPAPSHLARQLTIISHANADTEAHVAVPDRGDSRGALAIYVADVRPLPSYPIGRSAFLAGQSQQQAVDRVLRLVGFPANRPAPDQADVGVRFPGAEPAVFNVPVRNTKFTGREADLRQLRANLLNRRSAALLTGDMPIALQGMGGIGKTQLAMEYAHRFKNAYDVVWWVPADPVNFVDTELADLAARLDLPQQSGIPDIARSVISAISRGLPYERVLLVFDNAEDVLRVVPFLPTERAHVLITSRNKEWADRATAMQVEVFQRGESIAHLRQRVPTIKPDEANRVAELLGDLPIAVAAAGAWIAETGTDVSEYLRHIERHGPANLVNPPTNLSVEATWDLSLQRLRERSPAAYRLLQLCSLMAPEIALDLIYSNELAAALVELDPAMSEPIYRGVLVQEINRLALLKLDVGSGQIQVHRLLQHVVRSRMSATELEAARHQVHLVLAASRPRDAKDEVDNPDSWRRYRMLWPHLEFSGAMECEDESVRQLMIDRLRYVWFTGGITDGRTLGTKIDATWTAMLERTTGEQERRTLQRQLLHLRFNLANVLCETGLFEESRRLDEEVLEQQTELLGEHHPHTLMTAGGLGRDLRALGLYTEALARDEITYKTWSEFFGDDHPRTFGALNNLAVSYRLVGDFRQARERDTEAYEGRRKVLGELNPYTLASGECLGRDIREAGDYDGSVKLLGTIASRYEQVLPDTARALVSKANLAVSLRSAGRAAQAAPLLEDAYEKLNELRGPASPDTLAVRLSRACNILAVGAEEPEPMRRLAYETAASETREVENAYSSSLGRRHPHTLVCLNNRAAIARATGDLDQAERLAAQAVKEMEFVLGAEHPYTLAARLNLAVVKAERGDLARARELISSTWEVQQRVAGPEHPDTLRCQANVVLIHRGSDGSGEAAVADVLERLTQLLGDHHPAVTALREGRHLHRVLDPHPF
ncbi:FxSxx-COOH system tetratricopeptide repeat protein [Dactylosporangium sp. NBC_01737]|uniref:FxSxx-COOH system tetratricopeptide repeat protein n=1 Tax=Dactylosporangium sp. NBC_01737 TaxID=2975959 RepID=UPI002E1189DC|nr:FxSxx-COOH system tetratricopeptide repeat protein [Dactylosporangium sp. NBC_01737]